VTDKRKAFLETSFWIRIFDREDPARRRTTRLFLHIASRKLRWFLSATVRGELQAAPDLALRRAAARQVNAERPRTLTQTRRAARILDELLDRRIGTPARAADMMQLSIAIDGGMDFLVTWDVRHLANERVNRMVRDYCRQNGYNPIRIGTPEQVLEWLIAGRP
jgi:predicted nucleic acid-binding protein